MGEKNAPHETRPQETPKIIISNTVHYPNILSPLRRKHITMGSHNIEKGSSKISQECQSVGLITMWIFKINGKKPSASDVRCKTLSENNHPFLKTLIRSDLEIVG